MTDGEGTFEFTLELVCQDTGATVMRVPPIRHTFRDRLVVYPFHIRLKNVPFEVPGWYEVRLYYDGADTPVARQALLLRQADP
jgi:hypothetical protein